MLSATFGSAVSIGGEGSDGVFDIAADGAGNSYVTGYFSGTVDFDLSQAHLGDADILSARGAHDGFVAKYAPDDSLVWVRRMGGDAPSPNGLITDVGRSVTVDEAGNVYVVGEFSDAADFGSTTHSSAGSRDGFVATFDASGEFRWSARWGTSGADVGYGVAVDSMGNVYTLSTGGSNGHHIRKFGQNGVATWTMSVGGASTSPALAVSPSGNVFVAGSFFGTVDFDPGTKVKNVSSGSSTAGFVLKLDTNGKFGWVTPFAGRTIGSTIGTSAATAVTLDANGNVIVGGHYRSTVDFNPGAATTTLDPMGGGYVAKLNSSGGLVWARPLLADTGSGIAVYGVATDSSGSAYATGRFTSTIDLDPGTVVRNKATAGDSDIFVVKLTSTGNYVWGETFGGVGSDIAFGVDVDNAGFIHLAGYYADIVDFDSSPMASHTLGAAGAIRDGFRLRLRQA